MNEQIELEIEKKPSVTFECETIKESHSKTKKKSMLHDKNRN